MLVSLMLVKATLTTTTGQSALESALASGGNPFLAIFNFALHESVQQYGMKQTLEVIVGITSVDLLSSSYFYKHTVSSLKKAAAQSLEHILSAECIR